MHLTVGPRAKHGGTDVDTCPQANMRLSERHLHVGAFGAQRAADVA